MINELSNGVSSSILIHLEMSLIACRNVYLRFPMCWEVQIVAFNTRNERSNPLLFIGSNREKIACLWAEQSKFNCIYSESSSPSCRDLNVKNGLSVSFLTL